MISSVLSIEPPHFCRSRFQFMADLLEFGHEGNSTPEAAEELFGSLFQEATFLRLSALDFRNPNREVAEYWYCSDYCARDHIENRINDKEEQRRSELEADQLAFSFFSAA